MENYTKIDVIPHSGGRTDNLFVVIHTTVTVLFFPCNTIGCLGVLLWVF